MGMREKITGAEAFMLDLSLPVKQNRPCLSPPCLGRRCHAEEPRPRQFAPVIFLAMPDSNANTRPFDLQVWFGSGLIPAHNLRLQQVCTGGDLVGQAEERLTFIRCQRTK